MFYRSLLGTSLVKDNNINIEKKNYLSPRVSSIVLCIIIDSLPASLILMHARIIMSHSNTKQGESICLICVQWFKNKNKQNNTYLEYYF